MSRTNGRTTLKRITKQTAVYFVQKRGAGRGVAFSKLFESLLGASNILCFMEQNSHLCDALSDALFFPSRIFLLFRLSDTSGALSRAAFKRDKKGPGSLPPLHDRAPGPFCSKSAQNEHSVSPKMARARTQKTL